MTMRERLREQEQRAADAGITVPIFSLVAVEHHQLHSNVHPGRTNLPVTMDVALLFEGETPPGNVVLQVQPRHRTLANEETVGFESLDYYNRLTMPLTYPMLYPRGELGHDQNKPHVGPNRTTTRNRVTYCEAYAYHLHKREMFTPLHYAGRLFQKFCVDSYVAVEAERMSFIRRNQDNLLCDTYRGLLDYVARAAERENMEPGRVVMLPTSFSGSPRNMHKLFLDSMAVVRKLGKPDLFITMTMNSDWPEIKRNLIPGQKWENRPDVCVRVFKQKFDFFRDLVKKAKIFGECTGFIHSIEFQKRGPPHAHCVIFLGDGYKIATPEEIDRFVSATIPDQKEDPELYELVKKFMLHGHCGDRYPNASCMKDGKCSRNFPFSFCEETVMNNGKGKPKYRKPNNGRTMIKRGKLYTNQRVVPYVAYGLKCLQCHMNGEVCTTYGCLRYLFKYLFKGYDVLTLHARAAQGDVVLNYDECSAYIAARFVSPCEALWRIFMYPMHSNDYTVKLLPVHLEDQQNVTFVQGQAVRAAENNAHKKTMLEGWFEANKGPHKELANTILYPDFPTDFTWDNKKDYVWNVRKRNIKSIGRMIEVSPNNVEKWYLRTLLNHVTGATSYEDLRTYQGVIYETFREACIARGLCKDDTCYHQCIEYAAMSRTAPSLRRLLAYLIVNCEITDLNKLFDDHLESFTHDLIRRGYTPDKAKQLALAHIAKVVLRISGRKLDQEPATANMYTNNDLSADMNEVEDFAAQVQDEEENVDTIANLNDEQKVVFDTVMESVDSQENTVVAKGNHNMYFLNGAGGCGKTYLYNTITRELEKKGHKVVSMAWTGIASLLLKNGATCHNRLGLPLDMHDSSSSSFKRGDSKAELLKQASLIIWDEAPMAHQHALRIMDSLLRFIMNNKKPMGGKLVLMGGDFRQLPPVVNHGKSACASLASSLFFKNNFRPLKLTKNLRAGAEQVEFAAYLEKVGDGKHTPVPNKSRSTIEIPSHIVVERQDLLQAVFQGRPSETAATRCILCPTNAAAAEINDEVLASMPGQEHVLLSEDTKPHGDVNGIYMPEEVMNSLTPQGMPPHQLKLKVNCIVMLQRNLDISAGLCNGTRMRVLEISPHVIRCELLTGEFKGRIEWIPRMPLTSSESSTGLPFTRDQIPVRLSFATTINKSQGQSYEKIGIYLNRPCFAHGQLYVAMSRVSRLEDISFCVKQGGNQGKFDNKTLTLNIVDPVILAANYFEGNGTSTLSAEEEYLRQTEEREKRDEDRARHQERIDAVMLAEEQRMAQDIEESSDDDLQFMGNSDDEYYEVTRAIYNREIGTSQNMDSPSLVIPPPPNITPPSRRIVIEEDNPIRDETYVDRDEETQDFTQDNAPQSPQAESPPPVPRKRRRIETEEQQIPEVSDNNHTNDDIYSDMSEGEYEIKKAEYVRNLRGRSSPAETVRLMKSELKTYLKLSHEEKIRFRHQFHFCKYRMVDIVFMCEQYRLYRHANDIDEEEEEDDMIRTQREQREYERELEILTPQEKIEKLLLVLEEFDRMDKQSYIKLAKSWRWKLDRIHQIVNQLEMMRSEGHVVRLSNIKMRAMANSKFDFRAFMEEYVEK
jgi:PIF1-like helicase/Helitron helicase-like domain at N-terminus